MCLVNTVYRIEFEILPHILEKFRTMKISPNKIIDGEKVTAPFYGDFFGMNRLE